MVKKILISLFVFSICLNYLTANYLAAESVDLDTDNNGRKDRWMNVELYKNWQRLDVNKNNIPDESCFFVADSGNVFFINEEKFDYSGNGSPDIWIKNSVKGKSFFTEISSDTDNNGKIDLVIFKKNDVIYKKEADYDKDDSFDVVEKYNSDGAKVFESVDTNKDGEMDDFYYYRNEVLVDERIDSNFDGKPDMWIKFNYNHENVLTDCVIEKDNNFDGNADEWHYSDEKRRVIRIEKDDNFDGKVDSIRNL